METLASKAAVVSALAARLDQSVPPALKAKPGIRAFKAPRWLVLLDPLVVPVLRACKAQSVIGARKGALRLAWLVQPVLLASRGHKAKSVRQVLRDPSA